MIKIFLDGTVKILFNRMIKIFLDGTVKILFNVRIKMLFYIRIIFLCKELLRYS